VLRCSCRKSGYLLVFFFVLFIFICPPRNKPKFLDYTDYTAPLLQPNHVFCITYPTKSRAASLNLSSSTTSSNLAFRLLQTRCFKRTTPFGTEPPDVLVAQLIQCIAIAKNPRHCSRRIRMVALYLIGRICVLYGPCSFLRAER
jgi:hypothetical protein